MAQSAYLSIYHLNFTPYYYATLFILEFREISIMFHILGDQQIITVSCYKPFCKFPTVHH